MDADRATLIAELGGWSTDEPVEIDGLDPILPTPWPVGDVAAVDLAQAGAAATRLARRAGGDPGLTQVSVADAAAATIGFAAMRVDGELIRRTNAANPWVGRYRCADGRWIHLHGGFPPLAERHGCAAIIRTSGEWRAHPQRRMVHAMAAVVARERALVQPRWSPSAGRPIDGLRVLDLTRVLAGPTAGRTLAAFGADVLHV